MAQKDSIHFQTLPIIYLFQHDSTTQIQYIFNSGCVTYMSSQVKIIGLSACDRQSQGFTVSQYRNHQGRNVQKTSQFEDEEMRSQQSHIKRVIFQQLVFMSVHYIDVWIINKVFSHCMFDNLPSQQLTFLNVMETDFLRPLSFHMSLLSSSFVFLPALPPGIHITICFTPSCASVVCHATMKGSW